LRDTYRQHRPMVERSIAWLIGPKGCCRQLRSHGVTANDWWLHTRMAALNLRRLVNPRTHPHRADLDTHVSRLTAQPTGRC
jgi:hypothetical protein